MTKTEDRSKVIAIKALLERDEDFVRSAVQSFVQAALEAEMTEALGAEKREDEARLGYRSGYYQRSLITRVGTLELRVPQDRAGRFSTELFERYQRSEKALVGTLARCMCKASRPEGEGRHRGFVRSQFSASSISAITDLIEFACLFGTPPQRRLPYLILDAATSACARAASLSARRCRSPSRWTSKAGAGLAVELAAREPVELARFSLGFEAARPVRRRVRGSDDHAGLKAAIREVCRKRFGSAAMSIFKKRARIRAAQGGSIACGSCAGLRPAGTRRGPARLAAWLSKWQAKYQALRLG